MGDFNRSGGGRAGRFGGRDGGRRNFGGGRDGGRGFGGRDGGRNSDGRGFGGGRDRDSGPREMFSAVCDNCGKNCEVPFRPTQGKPIFCSECFEKKENGSLDMGGRDNRFENRGNNRYERDNDRGGNRFENAPAPMRSNDRFGGNGEKGSENFKVQYEILNAKLDKILKLLEPKPIRVTNVNPELVQQVKEIKIATPKDVAAKSVTPKAEVKKTATKKVAVKKAPAKKVAAKKV